MPHVDLANEFLNATEKIQGVPGTAERVSKMIRENGIAGPAARFQAAVGIMLGTPPDPNDPHATPGDRLNGKGRVFLDPSWDPGTPVHPFRMLLNRLPIKESARGEIFKELAGEFAELPIEGMAQRLASRLDDEKYNDVWLTPPPPTYTFTQIRHVLEELRPQLRPGIDLDAMARELDRQSFHGDVGRYVSECVKAYPHLYWKDPNAQRAPYYDFESATRTQKVNAEPLETHPRYSGI